MPSWFRESDVLNPVDKRTITIQSSADLGNARAQHTTRAESFRLDDPESGLAISSIGKSGPKW